MFHTAAPPPATYRDTLELNLAAVEPSLAGPSRPQDRVRLADVKKSFAEALPKLQAAAKPQALPLPALAEIAEGGPVSQPGVTPDGVSAKEAKEVHHGSVVITAIT